MIIQQKGTFLLHPSGHPGLCQALRDTVKTTGLVFGRPTFESQLCSGMRLTLDKPCRRSARGVSKPPLDICSFIYSANIY